MQTFTLEYDAIDKQRFVTSCSEERASFERERRFMPRISTFYGLVVLMFWEDHNPPHFHVRYTGHQALIRIDNLEIIEGQLPHRAEHLVMEWAKQHQAELMENWESCRNLKPLKTIAPLP